MVRRLCFVFGSFFERGYGDGLFCLFVWGLLFGPGPAGHYCWVLIKGGRPEGGLILTEPSTKINALLDLPFFFFLRFAFLCNFVPSSSLAHFAYFSSLPYFHNILNLFGNLIGELYV